MKIKIFIVVALLLFLIVMPTFFTTTTASAAVQPDSYGYSDEAEFWAEIGRLVEINLERNLDGGLEKFRNDMLESVKYALKNEDLSDEEREEHRQYINQLESEKEEFYRRLPKIRELAKLIPQDREGEVYGKYKNVAIAIEQIPDDEIRLKAARSMVKETPMIRAIWCDEDVPTHHKWIALGDCYIIRVAKELDMKLVIVDVTNKLTEMDIQELEKKKRSGRGFWIGFDEVVVIADDVHFAVLN